MDLAAQCNGGVDFLGMFKDPVGIMLGVMGRLTMNAAFEVFGATMGTATKDQNTSDLISGQVRWVVVYLSIGSMLFAAIKMALDRRGEAGATAMKGIVRVVVVSTAATAVIDAFVTVTDNYSQYLLNGSFEALGTHITCDRIEGMLLLVIACLLLLSAIIQAILMWVRLGVMIILMGMLPVAASASMTEWGQTWWRKHIGWMIAWLLYKPALGLIIWSGALMVGNQANSDVNTQLGGMAVLLLSAIALPALMRVVVPATAALGGDAVGSTTMGLAGGIASGAKSVVDLGGGSSGSRGPSGSSNHGGGSSGGGTGGQGRAAASSGGGKAAAAANPALAAAVMAAETAGKILKGAANVAASGVDTPRNDDDEGQRRH